MNPKASVLPRKREPGTATITLTAAELDTLYYALNRAACAYSADLDLSRPYAEYSACHQYDSWRRVGRLQTMAYDAWREAEGRS